ncbi:MAG: hypothetical protein HY898_02970 [Deltaproteobacteria bacterium]|nr:hypothetical protein [Deltaproteobacteria bacterium]
MAAMAAMLSVAALANRAESQERPRKRNDVGVLVPGITYVYGSQRGAGVMSGFGLEVSWMQRAPWAEAAPVLGFLGPVLQAGVQGAGDALSSNGDWKQDHGRFMLGGQIGSLVGLELGPSLRTGTSTHAPTLAAHLAPYLTLGIVGVSGWFELFPTALRSGEAHGAYAGITLLIKLPLFVASDHVNVLFPSDWFGPGPRPPPPRAPASPPPEPLQIAQ